MNISPYTRIPRTDEQGAIAEDLVCLQCGYNLRGINQEGTCPECGLAVGRSVHGDLLQFAMPQWVEQLASGTQWLLVSIVLGLLSSCFVGDSASFSIGPAPSPGGGATPIMMQMIVSALVWLVAVVGWWKITTPEPSKVQTENPYSMRIILRWTVVAGFILGLLEMPLAVVAGNYSMLLWFISVPIDLVSIVATGYYMSDLARRIPDRSLQRNTMIVMWIWLVCLSAMLLLSLVALAAVSSPGAQGSGQSLGMFELVMPVIVLLAVGLLITAIWGLILLLRFYRGFKRVANLARKTWAEPV